MEPPPRQKFDRDLKYTEEWLNQGHIERVFERCQEALKVDPDCVSAYKVLGNICAAQGEIDQAIQWYESGLKRQPKQAEIHVNLGSIFARKQQFKLAGAYYQKAIAIDPNFFIAHVNLANIWQRLGKDKEATDCLYRASQLQPDRFGAEQHFYLGNKLLEQQQLSQAIACYHRAIEIDPKLLGAYENLAEALIRQGNTDEANRYHRRARELKSTQTPHPEVSNSQKQASDPAAKDATVEPQTAQPTPERSTHKSTQTLQSDLTARDREEAGDACVVRGELDEAVSIYRQALELAPRSWQLYHKLGDVLQAQGKLYEALEAYDRATTLVTSPEAFQDLPPSA